MLSTTDIEQFIQISRQELDKEKRKLTAQNEDITETSVQKNSPSPLVKEELTSKRRSAPIVNKSRKVCPVVKRSVSTSPLRRRKNKDYSQELQIQIYPTDADDLPLLSFDGSSADLLETVSLVNGDDSRSHRSGSQSERSPDDIRKYCLNKLGGMLRTGEFSPNHPEMGLGGAVPRIRGDAFVGLGLYEEKRRELMARRKREYREYLANQKNLNAIAKEKERLAIERNNNWYENQFNNVRGNNPGYRDSGEQYHDSNRQHLQSFLSPAGGWKGENYNAMRPRRPSSIAVQTEDDLLLLDQRQSFLTQAERELSPRPSYAKTTSQALQRMPAHRPMQNQTAGDNGNPDWRMLVEKVNIGTQNNLIMPPGQRNVADKFLSPGGEYEDGREYFDAINGMNSKILFGKDSPRAKLLQDLRHTHMPSLFDEGAIQQRNMEMEKDAAAKRASYQNELKKQIDDQHKLREERKAREKMLEEAETRRLEEQLKLLKFAHEAEMEKQKQTAVRIKKDSTELERQRLKLQSEIDFEKRALRQAKVKQNNNEAELNARMCRSDPYNPEHSNNLPFYYPAAPLADSPDLDAEIMSYNLRRNNPYLGQDPPPKRVPYSTNIADASKLTESIPVKNYNTNDVVVSPNYTRHKEPAKLVYAEDAQPKKIKTNETKVVNNRNSWSRNQKPNYEPTFLNKSITQMIDTRNLVKNSNQTKMKNVTNHEDSLPIPILREPERDRLNNEVSEGCDVKPKYSDAMNLVDDKWKVPAVQKNILKNNFSDDGKQQNILTQLGSIRRQLQLEQLKLDESQILPSRMVK